MAAGSACTAFGSAVAGAMPARPANTATSVPWPFPVQASEPYSVTSTRAIRAAKGAGAAQKFARRPHRPDGVGARWPEADAEQVEHADKLAHGRKPAQLCPRAQAGQAACRAGASSQ